MGSVLNGVFKLQDDLGSANLRKYTLAEAHDSQALVRARTRRPEEPQYADETPT